MKKSIRKLTAILLALIMGLSFTYTSYPVYAQDNIQTTGATSEQTENSVAKVGDNYYDDLAEALYKASETGEACDLLQDATITGNHDFEVLSPGVFGKSFDLKLNGFTIDGSSNLKFPGAGHATRIYGSGTINANVKVSVTEFYAPLTINGDITESGATNLRVLGSGVFRVNGDINEFTQGYDFGENVIVVCSGNYPADSPIVSKLDGNELINKNEPSNLQGFAGQPISTVSLPKDWSWMYGGEVLLSPGEFTWPARFNTTDYEMEYDFTNVDGYNQEEHYVIRNLTVNVSEEDIAKVVKQDGTEVLYSDIVEAFEEAENSTLYLLNDVEYDQRADSQLRALVPAKNMILKTNNYTLTCNGFYQYGNLGNPKLTIEGNGKDKIAVSIKDDLSNLTTTLTNAKIEVHSIGNGSLFVKSDSSVVGINDNSGEAPYLINDANLYLEDGAELIGTFEQPYDNSKIYTNVQPDKSKYNLKVPTNLELGNTYDLKLSEVFLNHSDIVNKGKIDVSISGIDKEGYITMKSTGNHTVYLPISIDGISSLTNGTVILSAEHRNPEKDEALHYNGNGQDSKKLIIGNEMFYIPDNSGEAPTKAELNHEVYRGTLTLTNNIDDTTKTINIVYDNRSENNDVPKVFGGVDLIRGTDGRMEYATSETSATWKTCDADNTKVEAGTYYVRYKETDTFKASKPVKVVVNEPEYKISTSKERIDFGTKHIGYKDISSESLEITNSGNVNASNIKVSLVGTNKDSFTLDTKDLKTSLTPDQKTSFTVVPNADLEAGAYTVQIEITADTNIKKIIDISFTVEGHVYENVVTPPTCTSKGYTTHTCEKCKHSYTDSETEMLPHSYKEEWESNETNHWHECECGAKADEATHTFEWIVDKEATHLEKGSKHEECTVCKYKKESVDIPIIEHTFGKNWVNNETNHWHECECGAKTDEDTHTFKWVVDKEATHAEKGSKHEECSICDYKKASVEIPVLTPTKPDKPNTDKPSEPTVPDTSVNDKTPETGEQTNLGLFASLLTVSGIGIAVLAVLKKKKTLENR